MTDRLNYAFLRLAKVLCSIRDTVALSTVSESLSNVAPSAHCTVALRSPRQLVSAFEIVSNALLSHSSTTVATRPSFRVIAEIIERMSAHTASLLSEEALPLGDAKVSKTETEASSRSRLKKRKTVDDAVKILNEAAKSSSTVVQLDSSELQRIAAIATVTQC